MHIQCNYPISQLYGLKLLIFGDFVASRPYTELYKKRKKKHPVIINFEDGYQKSEKNGQTHSCIQGGL